MSNESKKSIQKKRNERGKPGVGKTSVVITALVIMTIFIVGNLPLLKVGAAGTITGTVFQDFNGNGTFDTAASVALPAVDAGVAGITVTAYDSSGTVRGTATSGANGTYTLGATGTGPYRLEFTGIPSGFQPSARSSDSVAGGTATNAGSTVAFVADGNTGNVNLAINRPQDFCQNNPLICVPQFYVGNVDGNALRTFPYNYTSEIDGNINVATTAPPSRAANELAPVNIATNNNIGAVFGVAWDRATRSVYTSAFIKRSTKLGTLSGESTGAIYVRSNPTSATSAATLYVDLNAVFGANTTGANPHPVATTDFTDDAATNASVGKAGLGGLEISEDGTTLYAVNMSNKRLYLIPTSGALNTTTITSFAIPTANLTTGGGTCPTADVRPFGLGRDRAGQIYVGAVCSAESVTGTDAVRQSYLHAFIWRFTAGTYTLVANTTLNFVRASAGQNRPWLVGDNTNSPELMLSDIDFDRGNMIVGLRDKNGDEDNTGEADRGYGEILRAAPNGTNFTFENNGTSGGITTAGANTAGLGGGEYYIDVNGDNRSEGVIGGLLQVTGFNHTITTAYDAVAYNSAGDRISNFYTGGVQRYNNTTGVMTGAYDVYLNGQANTFRKANGLGDIEALCDSAPIEIGNRVWNDANGNGVQDPSETPIVGVTVELYNGATPVTYTRYRDEFTNIAYNGTNGSVDWSGTPWTEVGDDGSSVAGDVQVITASGTTLGNLARIGETGNGLNRVVNLAGSSSATLSFDYFRAAQGLVVQYSTDGTNYVNLQTIPAATDTVLQTASVALPVAATNIRFVSNTAGATNYVYLDNVQITTNAVTTTDANGEYYFSSAPGTTTGTNAVFDANILPNTAYQIRFSGTPIANLVVTTPDVTAQNGSDNANDSDVVNAAGGLRVINYTTGATAGSNDHTLDAGFVAPVSIGSTVFIDADNSGTLNGAETGVAGVTVELLYDANNNGVIEGAETTAVAAATTSTGAGAALGNYFFGNLSPGNYQVRIPTPPGTATVSSTVTATADNQVDNDDNGTQTVAGGATVSPIINLTPGVEPLNAVETGQGGTQDDATTDANGDMTVDFGFFAPASISNFVFSDLDRDGIQDAGEPGINGVTVTLYDAGGNVVATTTTATVGGVAGQYSFNGLAPGTYSVGFTLPTGFGYAFTTANAGADDAVDSDVIPATGRTGTYTLVSGQNNTTVDAGLVQTLSLGNQVYNDTNNNGVRDGAETGIVGATVNLYLDANNDGTPDGAAIATTTTGANGLYLFAGLNPGNYIVGVVTPTGLTSSSVNGGDPDANAADNDDNGVLVVGNETRSNPITLALTTEPTGETPTDGNTNTPDNSSNLTVDFGFTPAYSLGNRVFFDTNNNGQLNTGEVGVANVSVSVFASGDLVNAIGTVTTDANGYYRFDNLGSGTYVVRINPTNFVTGGALFGYQNTAGATAADVDSTNTLGGEDGINPTGAANTIQTLGISSGVITLGGAAEPTGETDVQASGQGAVDNQANMTIDFGFYRLSLSGTVFNDTGAGALNNNGIFDTATETGNAGVIVRLYDAVGNEVPVGPDGILGTADDAAGGLVTGANGGYSFQGLPPGDYTVRITPPAGTLSSLNNTAAPDPNNNTPNDDNGAPGTGAAAGTIVSLPITLTAGGEPTVTNGTGTTANTTLDFGLISGYSLGNRVWFDTNNDGLINAGELGIANVSVSIFADANGDGVIDTPATAVGTTTTDANGYYRFDNLTSGAYIVRINPANFANGAVLGGYQNTTSTVNNDTTDSTAVAGQNGENGINPTGAANTVQTAGIISGSIVLGPTGGTEAVGETDVQAAGQGTLDAQANMTIDFGFYRMNLSGTIWNDNGNGTAANANNGILNTGEPRIANVRVQIYSGTTEILVGPDGILGTSDDAAGGMLTNATGDYNFQGLPPGTYRVVVTMGNGTSSTSRVTDPNANVDNDNNGFPDNTGSFPGKIISGPITLTPGGEVTSVNGSGSTLNPTVDFGFVLSPTVVKLNSFDVFTDGRSVELKWSTGDEANNLGFNVYREVDGKRQLLNSAPIAGNALRSNAQLMASGQDYTWTDREYISNAVYYLEDLDVDGSANLNGAAVPQSKDILDNQPNAKMFSDLANVGSTAGLKEIVGNQEETALTDKELSASMARQKAIAALGGAKITITRDGWYRVSAGQLQAAGFDVNSNSQLWQLYLDGAEVPFKLNSDNSIEFFGRGLDTTLTDKQVYYLVNGQTSGLRIGRVEGGAANENADARAFDVAVERKDRVVYFSGLLNGDENNWFGASVNRSNQTVQNLTAVNVDAQGKARLSVKLQGVGSSNHSVNVRFNETELGTVEFSATENKQVEFDLPTEAVREGANSVYLQANGGSGSDISFVDTIRLAYQRGYTANENRLRFTVPAHQTARVNGFNDANISVYEIGGGAARQQVFGATENVEGNYGFSLSAANTDREMIAVVDSTVETAAVEKNAASTWSNAGNQANFVVITNSEMRESADKLAAMRNAQGLKTKVVMVDDLFDEFSFGRRDPSAVREFLRTATSEWKTKPQYALLFGDSSYDTRNNLGLTQTRDIVPTKTVDTDHLETSSDSWLADFNNDGAEDIALGRLPVGNASEAAAAVEKLARFDAQGSRKEKTDVLVADRGFENYSETLQTLLPGDVGSFRIDRSAGSDAETHQRIVEQLNNNPLLVTYTGHGSETVWAANGIFNQTDVAGLSNNQLSFYLLMNCLNGYNFKPTGDALGELLVNSPNGAIAVWASSGVTESGSQAAMSEAFTRYAFSGGGRAVRLGDVVKASKGATNDSDVRRTWQLLGDPTVFIK